MINKLEKIQKQMDNYNKVLISIQVLKSMLSWSDRLGTEEKNEIRSVIKILQEYGKE